MTIEELKARIQWDANMAFIIGNGINKFHNANATADWGNLLEEIWNSIHHSPISKEIFNGISLTEFYDILTLETVEYNDARDKFIEKINNIESTEYHQKLQNKLISLNRPVLTTNFDHLLETGLSLYKMEGPTKFSDYYPWQCYWGNNSYDSPTQGFGIWHINGMVRYKRSIKLGLTDYTRMASHTNDLIHSEDLNNDDFEGKNKPNWDGENTWLHLIFNCDLVIFGLGLEQNESYLRWLLIERAKYFDKFPYRKCEGWYVCPKQEIENEQGKKLFLEKLGIEVVKADSYDDIYSNMLGIE